MVFLKLKNSTNNRLNPVPFKKKASYERYDPKRAKENSKDSTFLLRKTQIKEQRAKNPPAPRLHRAGREQRTTGRLSSFLNVLFDFRFNHDKKLFYVFVTLLAVGVISVFSATIVSSYNYNNGDRFFTLNRHLAYIGAGLLVMSFFYFIRLEVIVKLWFVPLFVSIGLLLLIFVLSFTENAVKVDGATRWLTFGGFTFQPSDFAKLAFVIFVAAFLSNKKNHYKDFKEYLHQNLIPYAFWYFFILFLILVGNKNLGTALVIGFIGLTCYGVSAVSKFHLKGFLILLSILIVAGGIFGLYERYRMERIAVWTHYWQTNNSAMKDSECPQRAGCSDQFDRGITALGSGGLTGTGLGQSLGKFNFFKTTAGDDSIIAIMGEELGFFFTAGVILLYLYLVLLCLSIAKNFSHRPMYLFILVGCASWIGFQMFVHVGSNIGIIPLTGQTLPFISTGGSSLISLMCAMGLVLNASKQVTMDKEQRTLLRQGSIGQAENSKKYASM